MEKLFDNDYIEKNPSNLNFTDEEFARMVEDEQARIQREGRVRVEEDNESV